MTALDRHVAMLRGWHVLEHCGTFTGPAGEVVQPYSPSTNLTDAVALWEEARPEGWQLEIGQSINGSWYVVFENTLSIRDAKCKGLTDLPRAITQAWIEAKEAC